MDRISRLVLSVSLAVGLAACNDEDRRSVQTELVNFTGVWRGTGSVTDESTGETQDCESVVFEVRQTEAVLEILREEWICQGGTATADPQSVDIRNRTDLYKENFPIGKLESDRATFAAVDPEDSQNFLKGSAVRSGDHVDFRSKFSFPMETAPGTITRINGATAASLTRVP